MYPRTIDKARAHIAGTLGEYEYDSPMDKQLFATIGCSSEEFLQAVRVSLTDGEVADLLEGNKRISADELEKHNKLIDQWHPSTPDGWERFKAELMRLAPADHHRIKSRTDLIDFEEGRLPSPK